MRAFLVRRVIPLAASLTLVASASCRSPLGDFGECVLSALNTAELNPSEPPSATCESDKPAWVVAMAGRPDKQELRELPPDLADGFLRAHPDFDRQVCIVRRTVTPEQLEEWKRTAREGSIRESETVCFPTKLEISAVSVAEGKVFQFEFEEGSHENAAALKEVVAR